MSMFLSICTSAFFWQGFYAEIELSKKYTLPGQCLDGRLLEEPLDAITGMGVDSNGPELGRGCGRHGGQCRSHGSVDLRCVFRVAFYPCGNVDDYTQYDGKCDDLPAHPKFADRGAWPLRLAGSTGVWCKAGDIGSWAHRHCEVPLGHTWHCSDIGECNGYEKAVRVCASRLKREPYPCFMEPDPVWVHGKPWLSNRTGVRTEPPTFPAGWLVGGILSSLFFPAIMAAAWLKAMNRLAMAWRQQQGADIQDEQESSQGLQHEEVSLRERLCGGCLLIRRLGLFCLVWVGVCMLACFILRALGHLRFLGFFLDGSCAWETTLAKLAAKSQGLNTLDALTALVQNEPFYYIDWTDNPLFTPLYIFLGILCLLGCLVGLACLLDCMKEPAMRVEQAPLRADNDI